MPGVKRRIRLCSNANQIVVTIVYRDSAWYDCDMVVVWLTCVFQVPSYLTHVPSAFAVTSVTDVSSKMAQLCVFVTRLALLSTLLFVLLITRPTQTSVLWKSLHVRVVNASES